MFNNIVRFLIKSDYFFLFKKTIFMKQPIRKGIIEKHPEATPPIYTLLVDGTNLLKICMVDDKINTRGEHIGGIFQFLLQLRKMISTRDFNYVYVFFDDEQSGILRYNLYKPYKANRDKNYANANINLSPYMQEVNNRIKGMQNHFFNKNKKNDKDNEKSDLDKINFARERSSLCEIFNELFIRWMIDENTEVDDLISYYVQNKKREEKVVIMSSDHDLTQLLSEDVYIYNPRLKKNITHSNFKNEFGYPHCNVLIKKIMCGDTSDNISNISGLSENKLYELVPEIKTSPVNLELVIERAKQSNKERLDKKLKPYKYCENIVKGISNKEYDGDFYEINEKIIDLNNPLLTDDAKEELLSMIHAPQNPIDRNFGNLYKLIIRDDIIDLLGDNKFTSFFSPFKSLIDNEIRLFNE